MSRVSKTIFHSSKLGNCQKHFVLPVGKKKQLLYNFELEAEN